MEFQPFLHGTIWNMDKHGTWMVDPCAVSSLIPGDFGKIAEIARLHPQYHVKHLDLHALCPRATGCLWFLSMAIPGTQIGGTYHIYPYIRPM